MEINEDVVLTAANDYNFYKHFTGEVLPEIVERIRYAKWSKAEQLRIFSDLAEEAVDTYNKLLELRFQKYRPTPPQKKELAQLLYEEFKFLILEEL